MDPALENAPHIPVMLPEVLGALAPVDGGIYIDGTFGAGGYTRALLNAAECTVLAIDRDPTALRRAAGWKDDYGQRLRLVPGRFGAVEDIARGEGFESVDGFVLDIGVSSMQLDEAERGFSFRFDGPLDMRMDAEGTGPTAADIVNGYEEEDLANLIYAYGQERHSRRVARAIVRARAENKFSRTSELARVVRGAVPHSKNDRIDAATRTFQALRIAVNEELDELRRALQAAEIILRAGGRLAVVSFHSLEDGIVKHFMQERSGRRAGGSRHLPLPEAAKAAPTFTLVSAKAIAASDDEAAVNPRARSAKLRVAVRTDAPAWREAA